MVEIGQLCKIELDKKTVYKIIYVNTKKNNYIIDEVQTITVKTFVDVEEVGNSINKKSNIPIYNIHIIKE